MLEALKEICDCNVVNDYDVTIKINVPAENKDIVEIELWDILKALNQLPYEFDTKIEKVGEWL